MKTRKLTGALLGVVLTAAVVGGIALLLTKPLFFILALVILAVLYVGVFIVGPALMGEDK